MCGKPVSVGIVCLDCWFKKIVCGRTGTVAHAKAIRAIWDAQNGRCAYTGLALIPGANASLDHVVPVAKGGTHDPENMQWILERINRMKTDMDHDEFLAMCRLIAARH